MTSCWESIAVKISERLPFPKSFKVLPFDASEIPPWMRIPVAPVEPHPRYPYREPASPKLRMLMKPNYYAFRR